MTQKNSSKIISVVHPICCGLDVHSETYLMSKSKAKRKKALKLRADYLGFGLVPLETM